MAAARELVIWRGSQFSSKAIAALRVKGFLPIQDYKLSSAPMGLEERKKLLPAPYTVPLLRWDGEVVAGSDEICAFLDERVAEPLLYPAAHEGEVRRLERAASDLYWVNGWLSTVDAAGFERWSGARVRKYVSGGGAGVGPRLLFKALPGSVTSRMIHGVAKKSYLATLRRRGAELGGETGAACLRLAAERDTAAVMEEARAMLRVFDRELQASATEFFCGASEPTAADLTLYGMLERWLGNSLCPGLNGPAQPSVIDGMPGLSLAWERMHERFQRDCTLSELDDFADITTSVGDVTWSQKG